MATGQKKIDRLATLALRRFNAHYRKQAGRLVRASQMGHGRPILNNYYHVDDRLCSESHTLDRHLDNYMIALAQKAKTMRARSFGVLDDRLAGVYAKTAISRRYRTSLRVCEQYDIQQDRSSIRVDVLFAGKSNA